MPEKNKGNDMGTLFSQAPINGTSIPENERKGTGTMLSSTTIKAKPLGKLKGAVLDILQDENIQAACKEKPLYITKGKDESGLYLGHDNQEILSDFFFFSGSETEQFPSSERFLLSIHSQLLDEDIAELKERFDISSAEQLRSLVSAALAPQMTEKIQETQDLLDDVIK